MAELLDFSQLTLGESHEAIPIGSSDEHRAVVLALAEQAKRSLHIFSWNLDRRVFDNQALIDAMTRLALASPRTRIEILLQDPQPAVRSGHRLVNLAQRLSSSIEIRRPAEEFKELNHCFVVADETGILVQEQASRYEAVANFSARKEAGDLMKTFRTIWQRSAPETEFTRFSL